MKLEMLRLQRLSIREVVHRISSAMTLWVKLDGHDKAFLIAHLMVLIRATEKLWLGDLKQLELILIIISDDVIE